MNVLRRLPLNYIKYIFFFPLPTSNDFSSSHFRTLASDYLLFLPFLDIPLCPLFLCICSIIIFGIYHIALHLATLSISLFPSQLQLYQLTATLLFNIFAYFLITFITRFVVGLRIFSRVK